MLAGMEVIGLKSSLRLTKIHLNSFVSRFAHPTITIRLALPAGRLGFDPDQHLMTFYLLYHAGMTNLLCMLISHDTKIQKEEDVKMRG